MLKRSKMTGATNPILLAASLVLLGCYQPLHSRPPSDGSVDTGSSGGPDGGGGKSGALDSSMSGSGGISGAGGSPFDVAIAGAGGGLGSGGSGIDAPASTGESGNGGSPGSGGIGADVPAADVPVSSGDARTDAPLTCGIGTHNCGGACVSNYDLETCGPTECSNACKKPVGGSVTCDGAACVTSCPTTAPQNCDGTCIGKDAPCGGKCPGGQRYCSNSNTCINPSGCCSSTDCPAGGTNTLPTCTNNSCGIACSSASYTMCGSSCSDLGSDPNNCRSCGNRCGTSTPRCVSSSCVECVTTPDCSGNKVCSNNQCVCPNNDGACGATCTACPSPTPRCSAGTCVQCLTTADCASNATCVGKQCKAPLACGDTLPPVTFPTIFTVGGSPPLPSGGAVTEGDYALTRVECYGGNVSGVSGDSFRLQNGAFHHRRTSYSSSGSPLSGYEELGTYSTSGAIMSLNVTKCGTSLSAQTQWTYTAMSNQIQTFTGSGEDTCIQTFAWQP